MRRRKRGGAARAAAAAQQVVQRRRAGYGAQAQQGQKGVEPHHGPPREEELEREEDAQRREGRVARGVLRERGVEHAAAHHGVRGPIGRGAQGHQAGERDEHRQPPGAKRTGPQPRERAGGDDQVGEAHGGHDDEREEEEHDRRARGRRQERCVRKEDVNSIGELEVFGRVAVGWHCPFDAPRSLTEEAGKKKPPLPKRRS